MNMRQLIVYSKNHFNMPMTFFLFYVNKLTFFYTYTKNYTCMKYVQSIMRKRKQFTVVNTMMQSSIDSPNFMHNTTYFLTI